MEYGIALIALAALVAAVLARPLLQGDRTELKDQTRIEELQAAKEAKYREIRDAELDHRMGKLSREDWRAVDRDLRDEAMAVLQELDRLEGNAPR